MKMVLAGYGTRGDTEPFAAVGRELLRRGHDVCMAVAPELVGFLELAELDAVPFGPESLASGRNRTIQDPVTGVVDEQECLSRAMVQWGTTLTALANGADLLITGRIEQGLAANVAEYYGIPQATLHFFPGAHLPLSGWAGPVTEEAEAAQRRALGLPEVTEHSTRSLEIQAYDALCFPELAAEWADGDGWRPFVGALTLELPTEADDEVLSWIAEGTPPIYFGFGSGVWLPNAAQTVGAISVACARLGKRALFCSGASDFNDAPHSDHVKVVGAVNHSAVFPACRAVVHQGGAGTTAAGMRAGIPTLILWHPINDQRIWADAVRRLKVGSGRAFSVSNLGSLVADLRSILDPQCITRAREVAAQMTKPALSVASAADLLEDAGRMGRVGA
ncbi:glycosyltransferase [Candidatus Mycobacterium methanotrophicum]|uniref:Glycosyltransferase n=1 Tax=Candidatus Mycobacterium methanotrophicum TaxID=2943498 RepID=A0ABY4QKH7_9MYCO|nr:glycosyltransferase [Candidatus Mycobacterium methanotrophicum]UQX10486.1 glycosyltransferase [Candidatus Mycobacterium methanotrophicum]